MALSRNSNNRPLVRDRLTLVLMSLLGLYFIVLLFLRFAMKEYEPAQPHLMKHAITMLTYYLLGASVFLRALLRSHRAKETRWPHLKTCLFLAFLTIASRLLLFILVTFELSSDYKMYYEMADLYAKYGAYNATDYIVVVAPNIVLYIISLGEVFRTFGSSLLTAQCFNLLLLTGSVISLYYLSAEFLSRKVSRLIALGFVLSPSNLLFSLVIGTEPIALFPYLGGMLIMVRALKKQSTKRAIILGFVGGIVLGISNASRSNALIAMLAIALWGLLCVTRKKRAAKQVVSCLTAMLIGALAFSQCMSLIVNEVFQGKSGRGQIGWTLYEGLDSVTAGGWRQENSDVLYETIENYPVDQVQSIMLQKALARVAEYSAETWLRLILRKGVNIWVFNDYAYQAIFNRNEASILNLDKYKKVIASVVNDCYLFWLMMMALAMLYYVMRNWNNRLDGTALLLVLPITFMVLWHSVATSIPRYHYFALPSVLLMTFYCTQPTHSNPSHSEGREAEPL
ncbi:MAG: ArnT family glycosyltransferase [Christensenellales bacterium]